MLTNQCVHGHSLQSAQACKDCEIERLTRERDEWSGVAAVRNREIAQLRGELSLAEEAKGGWTMTKQQALDDLLDAVEGVLWFDWGENDADAVEAIERLRKAQDTYGQRASRTEL